MRIHLYIVDTDQAFIVNALSAIANCRDIVPAGYASNGAKALSQITSIKPDVILTDLQLPDLDGVSLIRAARRLDKPPVCIACTRFYSDAMLDSAQRSGAAFMLYKPIRFQSLSRLITDCWRGSQTSCAALPPQAAPQSIYRLRELLNDLGIPPRLQGSLYLVEAVTRLKENELLIRNLSQGLYADLARRLHATPDRVERSLRSAIAYGFNSGAMQGYFSHRPTNREFIRFLLEQLSEMESPSPLPRG